MNELINVCFEVSLPLYHGEDLNLTSSAKRSCATQLHHMTTNYDVF